MKEISFWEKIPLKNPIFPSDFVNRLNDDPFQRSGRVRLDHIVLQPPRVSNHPVINSKEENCHGKKKKIVFLDQELGGRGKERRKREEKKDLEP